jgi:AAA+ superfamily predicted ATPase
VPADILTLPGIIIMATNRVRSIDAAVQSRIQLTIQYRDLKPSQREAIYLNRLKYIPDNEIGNRAELERGLKDSHLVNNRSSTVKPNGRQIRNIVAYARALAKSEDKLIDVDHLIRCGYYGAVYGQDAGFVAEAETSERVEL